MISPQRHSAAKPQPKLHKEARNVGKGFPGFLNSWVPDDIFGEHLVKKTRYG
jgi:hypothetical protein